MVFSIIPINGIPSVQGYDDLFRWFQRETWSSLDFVVVTDGKHSTPLSLPARLKNNGIKTV